MNPKIIQFPHDATDCIVRMNVLADILLLMPPEQIIREGLETFLAIAEIARKLATVAHAMLEEGKKNDK